MSDCRRLDGLQSSQRLHRVLPIHVVPIHTPSWSALAIAVAHINHPLSATYRTDPIERLRFGGHWVGREATRAKAPWPPNRDGQLLGRITASTT